jgi:hypothetical protein
VLDDFTRRAEVAHLETHVLFEYVRASATPNYVRPAAGAPPKKRSKP